MFLALSALSSFQMLAQQPVTVDHQSQGTQDPSNSGQGLTTPAADPDLLNTPDQTGTGSNGSRIDSPQQKADADQIGVQTKRILRVIPNYRSVSTNTYLPPQSFKEKSWLATQESFDYSAFIYEGMVAGIAMAGKSEPTFGQGA